MIGTRGVPARYGGFETAIEEVGRRLADRGHQVLVYCRNPEPDTPLPNTYLGMRLVELPSVKNRSLETLSHTALSVAHLLRRTHPDVAFVFNAANSPFLPALRAARIPVATHVDGLEWRRGKWGPTGKRYYRAAEALAVRYSDALIADAQGIADYYTEEFNAPTDLLAYGAPRIQRRHLAPGRAGPEPQGLPPGGGPLRGGEPRRRHRGGLRALRGHAAAGRRRLGPLRRRLHRPHRVPGRRPGPPARRPVGPGFARRPLLRRPGLLPRPLRGRYEPLPAARHRRRGRGGRLRRLLQPRGPGRGRPLLDHARRGGRPGRLRRVRRRGPERTRGEESRKRAALYDWDEVASGYEALARRLALEGPVRRRPSGRRTGKAGW